MTTYDRPATDHTPPTEVPTALLAARAGEFDRDIRARETRARRSSRPRPAGRPGRDRVLAGQGARGVGDPARGGTA
ncbi:hypothetical protein [Amycolatopsis thermophila]|uniref:Uncharacterized protein n=1 Tax=Amycolatopsis thermophila TaxID=206084 RepID=A0ABU0F2S7_9PSEU|nr:hypothetical protein [Amycolatopsis thermophila]MDQ0381884.1 hypothetical protein [Amycolatopsis thermophila]